MARIHQSLKNPPNPNPSFWHTLWHLHQSKRKHRPSGRGATTIYGTTYHNTGGGQACHSLSLAGHGLKKQRAGHWQPQSYPHPTLKHEKIHKPDTNMPTWRVGLSTDFLWIHGTSRQDNGEHWMVAEINRTVDMEGPAPAGGRNSRTWMASLLHQWIWQGSIEKSDLGDNWSAGGPTILGNRQWSDKLRHSKPKKSESITHRGGQGWPHLIKK